MRRLIASVLLLACAAGTVPSSLLAAEKRTKRAAAAVLRQQASETKLAGLARNAAGDPLLNHKIRLRDATTGVLIAETFTNGGGAFAFAGLAPGTYVIELVNAAGQVIGLSSAITLAAGAAAFGTVVATATGSVAAAAAAAGGGFSLLGLGTVTSLAVVAAAGAAAVTAVFATRRQASVSQ
jgi:hypothetical protein